MVTENQQTISEYFFFKQSTAGEALLTFLQGRLSTHLKKNKKTNHNTIDHRDYQYMAEFQKYT